ncbi:unnamed protein product [Schistosoma turkestanicum]|nr:unnamed protein product [Schistosoma turkestanicum]
MDLCDMAEKTRRCILILAVIFFYSLTFGFCYNGIIVNHKEVQILVDGIDNFCRLKSFKADGPSDAFPMFSGLSFQPSFLDFGEQPLSYAKHIEVTITNIDADQSIDLVTTFGASQFIFWSRFNQTAIAPATSANFNITFLPYTVGEFETSIYIQTSLGAAKYQVFGSSYISNDYLIPVVSLESLDANEKSFELKLVNPLSYPVKVDNLEVFSDKLHTDYCSYSQVASNSTSDSDTIDSCAFEPIILHSHESASLLKATVDVNVMELVQISSSVWEYDLRSQRDQIYFEKSTDDMVFLSSKLPSALISINDFTDQVLYSRVSLLYFGTINSQTDSVSKPIEILFLGDQPLELTSIEANIYDEALSITITEKIISPRTTIPKTVAIVTLSSAHLSRSYYLSGIITVYTNDKSIYLKIPFHGRFAYGSLTSNIQTVANYLNENYRQAPAFSFYFSLTNRYDFTVFISKIDFLKPNHKDLLQIHQHITHSMELIPNQTKSIMTLSMMNDEITRLHGSIIVYSSISTFHIPYDIFSGRLHILIHDSRWLKNTCLLGTILIGQICNQSVTIINENPVPIRSVSVSIYTESDNNDKCETIKFKSAFCHLSGPCEKCTIQLTEIEPLSEVNIPFSWGSENVAQHIKGFIQVQTKYTVIEQQFEYFVTRGLISVTPNPLIVNNLFPGKLEQHRIIVRNAYPTDINIADISLHPVIASSSDYFDKIFSFDTIQFYKIRRMMTISGTNSSYSLQPIHIAVNQSSVIGVAYFNPSVSCIDIFEDSEQYDAISTTITTTTTTSTKTKTINSAAVNSIGTIKPFCYCGFNLNTALGMLWLRGVKGNVNQSTDEIIHQSSLNHLLIEETFKLYNELYNQWLKISINEDTTLYNPNKTKNILTTISYELSHENVTFFSDLYGQFMWPLLVNTQKVPMNNVSMKHMTFCTIDNIPLSISLSSTSQNRSLPFYHLLHIPPITSSSSSDATNSFECIFQITNPQSTINPLFIQPILWNEIYKNYATNESKLNHLKELITNISKDSTLIDSLFTTDYGEFAIEPFQCSDCQSTNQMINSTYPPSYILPSNGSEQYFRLMFTPYLNLFELFKQNKMNNNNNNKHIIIRNLLIIRNNLTSIEPLWLEINFGQIGLTLGKLSTTKPISKLTRSITALMNEFQNDYGISKHTISPNIDLYIRNVPSLSGRSSSSGSKTFTKLKDDSNPSLKIDQILYDINLDFSSLFNNNTTHQKLHQDLSFKFDLNEKTIGAFCEPPNTAMIRGFPSLFLPKLGKQSNDLNYYVDFDYHKDLLTSLSLRRRLVLLNSGQVMLNIFMLSLVPSMNAEQKKFTESLYSHTSCSLSGFKLDPCILPSDENNNSNIITLLPGQQIIIELRHYPDFTHTILTTNLIIQLYPTLFQSTIIEWWNMQQLNKTNNSHILLIDLPKISLEANFNANLLDSCLRLLPRPSIESFLSIVVALAVSYGDAKEIYKDHIKLRYYIEGQPENLYTDSSKRFNLNQPNNQLYINHCTNNKNLCNPPSPELTTTSNSQLPSSITTTLNTVTFTKNHLKNNTIENDEITTLNSNNTGSKLKLKDKINSDEQNQQSKVKIFSTKFDWENYFQWLFGLLFTVKYISLQWILIIITYPYKTMRKYIICLRKFKDWLTSSLNLLSINKDYFRYFRQSSSDVLITAGSNNSQSISSNETIMINKRNMFGLSKQSSVDETKNQKASLKPLSKSLSKLTNQTSDKTSTTRVNRKKKAMATLVEIAKPLGLTANASDDHSTVSNRSRFTKIESISPPASTTSTTAVNKDASPPRMAEADIVAAVQASIRLTEDVNNHHHHHHHHHREVRGKQAQRITSRTKCHNSSSPSSTSGPDVDDNNNNKSPCEIDVFYRNDPSPVLLDYKSASIDKISSSFIVENQYVNDQNEKRSSPSTLSKIPFTKQLIDEYNENMAEQSVISQESLESDNHKPISTIPNPSNELDKFMNKNPHQLPNIFSNNRIFDWPDTIQTTEIHHYTMNDYYPLTIYPVCSETVNESSTFWNQPLLRSDKIFYSTDSPDEAMNRLSEETQTFAQAFITEPNNSSLSSFNSQFISPQFTTTYFIHEHGLTDYFGQSEFMSNDNVYSNMLDTMNEDNNHQNYISNENSSRYLSPNDLIEQGLLQTDYSCDYYVNKITVREALNTTLPIIYSLLQTNNNRTSPTALQSSSMVFPTNADSLDPIDTSLITEVFLDALHIAAHHQNVDETNFLHCFTNPTNVHIDDMSEVAYSTVNLSSENTILNYHENDNDMIENDCNLHESCQISFYELVKITESRRLSVLNYEAQIDGFIEEEKEVRENYFDLVPNPLRSNKVNNDEMASKELCSYSSWKSIVDMSQAELFQELELSETISEQYDYAVNNFINYEDSSNESSAIAPWTYIFEKVVGKTNSIDINQDVPLNDENHSYRHSSTFLSTTVTLDDMI